jgi:hypothetical protein
MPAMRAASRLPPTAIVDDVRYVWSRIAFAHK